MPDNNVTLTNVTLTKEEAIEAMQNGKRVSHKYFSSDEWMTMHGNRIILEDGCSCWADEFWADRTAAGWNDGYSIVKI